MKKWYAAYLIVALGLCIVGLLSIQRTINGFNATVARLHASERVTAPAPAPLVTRPQAPAVNTAAAQQAERIQRSLAPLVINVEAPPKPVPVPARFIVPRTTRALMPLDGWNDQPNKNRPGRIHTELMVHWGVPFAKHAGSRQPCLRAVQHPPERLYLPQGGGYVDVLQPRIVMVPCR